MASPEVIDISKIQNQNKTTEIIKIEGICQNIIPLLDRKGFEIKDQTGSIWVVTQGNIPKIGDRISVEGQLKFQEIVIGEEKFNEFYLEKSETETETEK
ncbi:hypothetical protein [Geminocystis sp. GBBB08]|uniref:hypothetical protein n=1 Tax=Geminocystis sp. GBBB08 TaxID=2604140 RepID=UPI0027E2BD93|nr:hypothetical protein [Geminocystis sp. GBBB08]MBL1209689.1 hypothetical protein [Geminocystis sp. GBBB08]